jgi:hypothetical protein
MNGGIVPQGGDKVRTGWRSCLFVPGSLLSALPDHSRQVQSNVIFTTQLAGAQEEAYEAP